MDTMSWKDHRDEIAAWVIEHGYQVEFIRDGDCSISQDGKAVEINSNGPYENQTYVLLHECGHLLIFENGSAENIGDMNFKYSTKSKISKIYTLMEEMEAWKRGKKLGKRLGIPINEKKWERIMMRALKTYMVWALR